MASFISMVFAILKDEGVDTTDMTPKEAIDKFNELGLGDKDKLRQEEIKNQQKTMVGKQNKEMTLVENEKLSDLGLMEDKDFLNSDKREYKKVKSFVSYLSKSKEQLQEILKDENSWLDARGTEPCFLKDVLDEVGYLQKPKIVSKKEFNNLKQKGAKVIYRGVPGLENASVQLRDSEKPFIGRGYAVNGMYFAPNYEKGNTYSQGQGSVAQAILNPQAKTIQINKLKNIDDENRMDIITDNFSEEYNSFDKQNVKLYYEKKEGLSRRAIEAVMLGYDAVEMENGDYVILNRGSLIMEGD